MGDNTILRVRKLLKKWFRGKPPPVVGDGWIEVKIFANGWGRVGTDRVRVDFSPDLIGKRGYRGLNLKVPEKGEYRGFGLTGRGTTFSGYSTRVLTSETSFRVYFLD